MKKYISKKIKLDVFQRDGFRCIFCGSGKDLECDHIIPESIGGDSHINNYQTLCRNCNSKKHTSATMDIMRVTGMKKNNYGMPADVISMIEEVGQKQLGLSFNDYLLPHTSVVDKVIELSNKNVLQDNDKAIEYGILKARTNNG